MRIRYSFSLALNILLIAVYQPNLLAGDIKKDYESSTPLPQTGKVTIRKPIQALPAKSLFNSCPAKSQLEEFAESTHYLIMVCRDASNNLKKYWIQKTRKTGEVLQLMVVNKPNTVPEGWKHGDYWVSLYGDGRSPELVNAYLTYWNPKIQQGRGEALIYYYSENYPPR
jgi:hypothetical protein